MIKQKRKKFYDYCASFYLGRDAIYPFPGLEAKTLRKFTDFYSKSPNFRGDSFDRELVRSAIEALGYREDKYRIVG